ncbi:helix-turn-helix domain-containing protein [Streptacidiphilus sp. 4-A2]|nr:helix-turn-helix domain-containing protein [Streptacidiphilus sp. 4-A2]
MAAPAQRGKPANLGFPGSGPGDAGDCPGPRPPAAAARFRSGLRGREAAWLPGLSPGYLVRLESGQRVPSVTVARRLAEVLKLTEDKTAVLRVPRSTMRARIIRHAMAAEDTRRALRWIMPT